MADLEIWVNAFIPRDVPGYTCAVPAGSYRGQTAVPLPWEARASPWCMLKPRDTGYLGDQRGFSNDPAASVRMQSMARVSTDGKGWTMGAEVPGRTSGTTEVNLKTGRVQGHGFADMKGSHFRKESVGTLRNQMQVLGGQPALVPVSDGDQGAVTLFMDASAGDPLVVPAAPIRFKGWFYLKVGAAGAVSLRWDLRICEFPAFEGYARYRGVATSLFQVSPVAGRTVFDLIKGSNQPQAGVVALR